MALQVGELLNDSNDINKDINWKTEEGLCAFRRWASLLQALAHVKQASNTFLYFFQFSPLIFKIFLI
jgi:hypothetical protein